ncbi:sensor histidine kinase [Nonomuraea sp. NPDC059007]|uniref:sensor histidine kinase n=1 Tax=Nonomuraea sp. NPDC059007 TaxID=3346692 RepID=UPI0036764BD8
MQGDRPGHARPGLKGFLGFGLLGVGVLWDCLAGVYQPVWPAWAGLALTLGLYAMLILSPLPVAAARWVVAAMAAVVTGMALVYANGWFYLFPLLALACALVLQGRAVQLALGALAAVTAFAVWRGGEGIGPIMGFAWGSFSTGVVMAAFLRLHVVIAELNRTRERLAEAAVAEERLRFSRDLHDLLGHTLSVIVVKAEAVRRLAVRDPEQAARQASDIESVGRQALTEVREAVTGYREVSLAVELERVREALEAAGVEVVVRRDGATRSAQAEALLSWVAREAATNILRHSTAAHAVFEVADAALTVRDDGAPKHRDRPPGGGLRGLSERLARAGGSVEAGPLPGGGYEVRASLPVTTADS